MLRLATAALAQVFARTVANTCQGAWQCLACRQCCSPRPSLRQWAASQGVPRSGAPRATPGSCAGRPAAPWRHAWAAASDVSDGLWGMATAPAVSPGPHIPPACTASNTPAGRVSLSCRTLSKPQSTMSEHSLFHCFQAASVCAGCRCGPHCRSALYPCQSTCRWQHAIACFSVAQTGAEVSNCLSP